MKSATIYVHNKRLAFFEFDEKLSTATSSRNFGVEVSKQPP
ncbi:Hypothetical protein LOCK908_0997 [Lacticaseibacillus rhamnosus LOCK908]|nr:Hypothetical protein LOCK908_0997 [Lacticaseibacillus rhamnosus LOCK908]